MSGNDDFFTERQKAIERMREMSRNSREFGMPAPPFVEKRNPPGQKEHRPPHGQEPGRPPKPERPPRKPPSDTAGMLKGLFSRLDLPFLQGESTGDLSLLLMLLLLLFDDGCDRLLLYALVYILL